MSNWTTAHEAIRQAGCRSPEGRIARHARGCLLDPRESSNTTLAWTLDEIFHFRSVVINDFDVVGMGLSADGWRRERLVEKKHSAFAEAKQRITEVAYRHVDYYGQWRPPSINLQLGTGEGLVSSSTW